MLVNLQLLLSMLALTEAAIIQRGSGVELSLTSVANDGTITTTIVDENGKVSVLGTGNTIINGTSNTLINSDNQALAESVSSALALTKAADGAAINAMESQATADAVAAALALTNTADEVAIMKAENGATADSVAAAFALINAAGASAMGTSPAPAAAAPAAAAPAPAAAAPAPAPAAPAAAAPAAAAPVAANLLPDGRIKSTAVATDFDNPASPFKSDFVKGDGIKFSDVVTFPAIAQSLFDRKTNTKAFGLSISDKSIFNNQTGFRRIGVLPAVSTTKDNITTTGIRTIHLSFQYDPAKPLNFSHEYQIGWLESADFSTNQFDVKVGTVLGQEALGKKNILIQGNQNGKPVQNLFSTPFTGGVWHNLAFTMDFGKNTIQTYYSEDSNPLVAQGAAVPNDMSGGGEYQFGLLKKPTDNAPGANINISGFQEAGIDEGLIFGGIFMEDSSAGLITLS